MKPKTLDIKGKKSLTFEIVHRVLGGKQNFFIALKAEYFK